jgi:RimJ/RimL family protein N-acetyltransferase
LEAGYWTVAEHRGPGYTTEALRAVCRWGFELLGVPRIEWYAYVGNVGSRVAEAVGFVMEGTMRNRAAHRGTRLDTWVAGLLPLDRR